MGQTITIGVAEPLERIAVSITEGTETIAVQITEAARGPAGPTSPGTVSGELSDVETTGYTAGRYLRIATNPGGVEERTTGDVLSDIGAAEASHTHASADITDATTTAAYQKLRKWHPQMLVEFTSALSGAVAVTIPPGTTSVTVDAVLTGFFYEAGEGAWRLEHGAEYCYSLDPAATDPGADPWLLDWSLTSEMGGLSAVTITPQEVPNAVLANGTISGVTTVASGTTWSYADDAAKTAHLTGLGFGATGRDLAAAATPAAAWLVFGIGTISGTTWTVATGGLILAATDGSAVFTINSKSDGTGIIRCGANFEFQRGTDPIIAVQSTRAYFYKHILSAEHVIATTYLKTGSVLYANLPSASTAGAGARHFITNCSHSTFGTAADGSGSIAVPVYSNGTAWIVG